MHIKSFYCVFNKESPLAPFYTIIEARTIADAQIYADIHWHPYVKTIYSSGQFWPYKRANRYIQMLPAEKETT